MRARRALKLLRRDQWRRQRLLEQEQRAIAVQRARRTAAERAADAERMEQVARVIQVGGGVGMCDARLRALRPRACDARLRRG